jgi:hypothetical protein
MHNEALLNLHHVPDVGLIIKYIRMRDGWSM